MIRGDAPPRSQFEERILSKLDKYDRKMVEDRIEASYNEGVCMERLSCVLLANTYKDHLGGTYSARKIARKILDRGLRPGESLAAQTMAKEPWKWSLKL